MDAFPAFVPLAGKAVVIAGEGEAAEAKARLFEGSPARVVRLAGAAAHDPTRYAGAALAFVTGDEAFCRAAAAAARAAGAWANAVDRPELCDFNAPGIVDRGAVVGAVGSVGAAPVLVVRLRQEIEARWPARLGDLAALMAALRPAIRAASDDWGVRRRLLSALMQGPWAEAALAGDGLRAGALARRALDEGRLGAEPGGGLVLVQAPSAPDLLTLRAVRALAAADRVWLSGEVHPEVLAHARRDAPRAAWTGAAGGPEAQDVVVGDVENIARALRARGAPFTRV